MLHCCLNCPFWLHENQAKCCRNLQLNGLFLGSWKIRLHRLEPKLNRITRNRNSSVPHFQSNRSVPSSQVTELAEEPKNRTDRFRLTGRPNWLIYIEGLVLSQLKSCPTCYLSFPTAKYRLKPSWKLTNQTQNNTTGLASSGSWPSQFSPGQ